MDSAKIAENTQNAPTLLAQFVCLSPKVWDFQKKYLSLAEILTSNSVGTQCFFLSCNLDNNRGYNFITKKKICFVHQKRKLATIEINKFII